MEHVSDGNIEDLAEGVQIESPRDERTLAWLVEQAGAEAVRAAVGQLAGQRRPYVSNIAKALGLKPPERLAVAVPTAAQRAALEAVKARLRGGRY